MLKLSTIHRRILKQIKKYPNGISTEALIKINNNKLGIEFLLSELKVEKYLSQLISEEDKLRKAFDLDVQEYTGDWVLTNKALAYLENDKLEFKLKIVNRLIGFMIGIATAFSGQFLIHIIFQQ